MRPTTSMMGRIRPKSAIWTSLCLALWLALGAGAAHADYYQATVALRDRDYARAAELFRELAELGNPFAQEMLAALYVEGEGVPRDNVLGYVWARLALENTGDGANRDVARNIVAQIEPHLKDADRARVAEVREKFGVEALKSSLWPESEVFGPKSTSLPTPAPIPKLEPGPGPVCRMKASPDPDKYYPIELKRQEISGAVMVGARVKADGSLRFPRAWFSFPLGAFDEAGRAIALHSSYTPAMKDGVPTGCSVVFKAKFSLLGKPIVPLDIDEIRRRAQAGDPNSQLLYGTTTWMYPEFRQPGEKDQNWILLAAQAGVPAAQYIIGIRLLNLDREPQEQPKGLRWLELAAKGGSGAAMSALGTHLLTYDPDASKDLSVREQAFEWLRRSAETSHQEGKYLFAALLASWPEASKRDPARALKLMNEIGESFDYDPLSFEIRAAAHAAQSDFKAAIRAQTRAVTMATKLGWNVDTMRARLADYEAGRRSESELVSF